MISRKVKNFISIFLIALLAITSYFSITKQYNVANTNTNMTPPNDNQNSMGEQPEKPEGNDSSNNMGEPPEKPDDNNSSNGSGTPPDMNSDNSQNSNDNVGPGNNQMMPDFNQNSQNNNVNYKKLIIFASESLLLSVIISILIMTVFHKLSIASALAGDKLIIFILLSLLMTGIFTFSDYYLSNKLVSKKNNQSMSNNMNNSQSSVSAKGQVEIDDTETLSGKTYNEEGEDTNAVLVKKGGNLTLSDSTINKTGDSSNTESSDFSGVNAAILAEDSGTATIKNITINTNAKGANAVFATGSNSKITISDSVITTKGSSSSRGLDATYGGEIIGDNLTVKTNGASSATLATDRGEGTVSVSNSKLETNGNGSPLIYSTGDISIDNVTGTANNSQMVVVEGKNSANVLNSNISASGKGNRNDVDNAGIMIYQSMSGDASVGTGNFTSKDSSLEILSTSSYYKSAPLFFVTNTDAVINLTNTKITYGSNILLSAKGTSEWGTSGSNGGNVTLNAEKQTLAGDIILDNISKLSMNLTSSTYKGTINSNNEAKSISLKLSKDSKITLTGDSYVTSLDNEDTSNSNIDFNGYKLYVNNKAIN